MGAKSAVSSMLLLAFLPAAMGPLAAGTRFVGHGTSTVASFEAEWQLFELHNEEREQLGLQPLRMQTTIRDYGRSHARNMADEGRLFHDMSAFADAAPSGWRGLAENVASHTDAEMAHRAFMESPDHRDSILGDYNYIGIGAEERGGVIYFSVQFMSHPDGDLATETAPAPAQPAPQPLPTREPTFFRDVSPDSTHYPSIIWVADEGIVSGYPDQTFRPRENVTRGQMATFLSNALGLQPASGDTFTDVAGNAHEASIYAIREAGITVGATADNYRPNDPVLRGQMASFLTRALDIEPVSDWSGEAFTDSSVHGPAIYGLVDAGVANGYPDKTFKPRSPITREQLATFLYQALD